MTIIPVPGPTDVTVGLRALDGQLPNDLTAEVEGTLNDMLVENSDELAAPAAEGDSTARITQMDRRTARQALTSALAAVSQGQYGWRRIELEPSSALNPELKKFLKPQPPRTDQKFTLTASCSEPWYPSDLTVKTGISSVSAPRRYSNLEFKWSSTRIANLHDCYAETFEPDFVTYNYDSLHYYSLDVTAWSSTMDDAYLDTQFGDKVEERNYSVGTSRGSKLDANVLYETYFRTTYGNSSTDTFKVNMQRGTRVPTTCDSTWCIFGREIKRAPSSGWVFLPSTWVTAP